MTENTVSDTTATNTPTAQYGSALPEELFVIGLDLDAKPHQFVDPRLRYPVNEALCKDLDLNDQLTDLLVFWDAKAKKLVVDDGRQRKRAASQVNQWRAAGVAPSGKTEPLRLRYRLVTKGTTMMERVAAMFAANELRVDDNAAVKAEKMAWFLKEYGETEENIEKLCVRMGLNRRRFDDLMALRSNAPETIFDAAKRGPDAPGGLGVEAAIAAADLPPERQEELVNELKDEAAKGEAPTQTKRAARGAIKLREEAAVAKAKAKGVAKYPKPTPTEKKDWAESVKHWNKVRKTEGKEPIEVDVLLMLGWLAGEKVNPLIAIYKKNGYPLD